MLRSEWQRYTELQADIITRLSVYLTLTILSLCAFYYSHRDLIELEMLRQAEDEILLHGRTGS